MKIAIWLTCEGIQNDGKYGHSMRDHCSSCAPYWEQYPACPDCKQMLGRDNPGHSGDKRKCPSCKAFVKIEARKTSPK